MRFEMNNVSRDIYKEINFQNFRWFIILYKQSAYLFVT